MIDESAVKVKERGRSWCNSDLERNKDLRREPNIKILNNIVYLFLSRGYPPMLKQGYILQCNANERGESGTVEPARPIANTTEDGPLIQPPVAVSKIVGTRWKFDGKLASARH